MCLRPQPWVLTQPELLEAQESLGDKVYDSGLGKALHTGHPAAFHGPDRRVAHSGFPQESRLSDSCFQKCIKHLSF